MVRCALILLATLLAVTATVTSALAQYRIGMSAAITGPASSTYAPTYEAYKAYFKRINDAGGINGRKVEIDYEDDRGEPQRAAAAAKKLAESSVLIVNASISATSKPLMIELENAEKLSQERGFDTTPLVIVPSAAADYTPFAQKLKDDGAEWVFAWSPWPVEIGVFEALNRLGWKGSYLLYGHQPTQDELVRLKAPNLYAFGGNSLFTENLPVHQEITNL